METEIHDVDSAYHRLLPLARPGGMVQGRGPMLAFCGDVLPDLPGDLATEHCRIVAESLAGGSKAFPHA